MSNQRSPYGVGKYQSVDRFSAVAGADKLRLVQLMMQGAKERIARAKGHVQRGEISQKGEQIGRAIALIDGLRASLDKEAGTEIAGNLERLYDYMIRKLLEANVRDDVKLLDEVASLIGEVKAGWDDLMRQAHEIIGTGAAPSPMPGGAP